MAGSDNSKNQHLKNIYKQYTNYIMIFEAHIKKLYTDLVIDFNERNRLLLVLDILIKDMFKIYNMQLIKHHRDPKQNTANGMENSLLLLKSIDNNIADPSDPFIDIRTELLKQCTDNGFGSMDDYLQMYIHDLYQQVLDGDLVDFLNLYNRVFVPIRIVVEAHTSIKSSFAVNAITSSIDSLIDNTVSIRLTLDKPRIKLVFDGYIDAGILNTHIRTSQIYSRHLYQIKTQAKAIITEEYDVDMGFLSKFTRLANGNIYFVFTPNELADHINTAYELFSNITGKSFNLVMKEFVRSDIKQMYQIINLLLMGSDQNISTAVLLFNLLSDKKVSGETVSDIIMSNLSYHSQLKIKKVTSTMKSELARIRALTPANISVEKTLASMVNIPDTVKAYILEKVAEIKSGESNYKLQAAINGLLQFPWKPLDAKNEFVEIKKSMIKSRAYLQNVATKLEEIVYGHDKAKKELVELVGKWIQNPTSSGQIIGLQGPPGTGKTLLAKSISAALNIPLTIVGLGGMSDSADLLGHSFTYAGAQYGMIIRQMIKAGSWRCVMFFDEVDKASKRNDTNEIHNTLIHITDPNMNQHFQDRFYSSSIDFDLSGVLIVFSYNDSSKLDQILLDRIKEIPISSYSTQEKINIGKNYVLPELCTSIGLPYSTLHIDDTIIRYITEKYTSEAGVRELRRKLEQILLKLNIDRFYMRGPFRAIMEKKLNMQDEPTETDLHIKSYVEYKQSKLESMLDPAELNNIFNLENLDEKLDITKDLVHTYLEPPVLPTEQIHQTDLVGVVNGLYATSIGMGGIVPIQIYQNFVGNTDGFQLKITGNQKNVMQESVNCAFTAATHILSEKVTNAISSRFPYGFHIHTPDNGTPKDGPSAGCAFATAFTSVLLGKRINRSIAMTGEIDLTGNISKIGGLDAKLFGANRAGVKCVYIAEGNHEDYEKFRKANPELFTDDFQVKIVRHLTDLVTDPNVIIDVSLDDYS